MSSDADAGPLLSLRTGFEVELLAPRGSSRRDLAEEIAGRLGGSLRRSFHTDSELSLVPGMGHFLHVTPGWEVLSTDGALVCSLVDDITIMADLDPQSRPVPGWYRLLTDDVRLLRLITRHTDPSAPLETVLAPLADLFGVPVEQVGGAYRVTEAGGATVALAATLPGERERPCEIVTAPLEHDHLAGLERLLAPARDLGFTVPVEAAVHLHLDAEPFRNVDTFCNVVRLFAHWRPALWAWLGTNPACRRLGSLPVELVDLVEKPWESWESLREAALTTDPAKYLDVNLTKVLARNPVRHTIEVRILPGSIDGLEIIERAALLELLFKRCLSPAPLPLPVTDDPAQELLALLEAG